jgi:hypothetical protein
LLIPKLPSISRPVVGSLFNETFSVTKLYSVDNRMINHWWWIRKGLVGSGCGLILRYYSGIRLERLRKPMKNINQLSRSQGPRIKTGTSRIRSRSVNHSTTTFAFPSWKPPSQRSICIFPSHRVLHLSSCCFPEVLQPIFSLYSLYSLDHIIGVYKTECGYGKGFIHKRGMPFQNIFISTTCLCTVTCYKTVRLSPNAALSNYIHVSKHSCWLGLCSWITAAVGTTCMQAAYSKTCVDQKVTGSYNLERLINFLNKHRRINNIKPYLSMDLFV